jgi:hypothetical protein
LSVASNFISLLHDRQQSQHVLEHREAGREVLDRVHAVRPQVPPVVHALALACMGKRLAWKPPGDDVDRLDDGPVDGGDVAEVGDAGMMGGEDLARRRVDLRVPRQLATQDRLHREVQPAVTGEQRPDADHVRTHTAMTALCDSRRVDGR